MFYKFFSAILNGHYCFYQKHLEGRQKEQSSNSNKKELFPNNRKTMYQGNTYVVLDEYRILDEEYSGREK